MRGSSISIHSLREEGDSCSQSTPSASRSFQSTPSARRETDKRFNFLLCALFQSTPSARRETAPSPRISFLPLHFNPLPPRGGRPAQPVPQGGSEDISIHSLREEGDFILRLLYRVILIISIHSLREEGDNIISSTSSCSGNFNPLPPRGGRP